VSLEQSVPNGISDCMGIETKDRFSHWSSIDDVECGKNGVAPNFMETSYLFSSQQISNGNLKTTALLLTQKKQPTIEEYD